MDLIRASIPAAPSAGLLATVFGTELRALGAIEGGRPLAPDLLELRFASVEDARAAHALLNDEIDGVHIRVRIANGRGVPAGPVSAGAASGLLLRVPGVRGVALRTSPERAVVVWSATPEVNSHLDVLVRDRIAEQPVVWQTRGW
jgi:hypothetical protein